MPRVSVVNQVKVLDVGLDSIMIVGDLVEFKPVSYALAVQRQGADFFGKEGHFPDFAIFRRPIPVPLVTEQVNVMTYNEGSHIFVNRIYVLGTAACALIQIGSQKRMDAVAKIKHIRKILRPVQVPRL